MVASATYNVYRKAHSPFLTPDQLMWRQRARVGEKSAGIAAPMRYGLPGERPPSMRPRGTSDGVMDRLDKLADRLQQGGGRIN